MLWLSPSQISWLVPLKTPVPAASWQNNIPNNHTRVTDPLLRLLQFILMPNDRAPSVCGTSILCLAALSTRVQIAKTRMPAWSWQRQLAIPSWKAAWHTILHARYAPQMWITWIHIHVLDTITWVCYFASDRMPCFLERPINNHTQTCANKFWCLWHSTFVFLLPRKH